MYKLAKIKRFLGNAIAKSLGWQSLIDHPNAYWHRRGQSAWTNSGLIDYRTFDSRELEAAYQTHPVIKACLGLISTAAPTPELIVERQVGLEWERVESFARQTQFLELLNRPNDEKSKRNMIASSSLSLGLHGVGMVQKVRNKGGQVIELWNVPISWILQERQNDNTGEIEYNLKSAPSEWFPRSDFIRPVFDSPSSNYHGTSPTQAAMIEIRSDWERAIYSAEMLVNMKVPGIAVSSEKQVSSETRDQIIEAVNSRIGPGHRGNLVFLNGGGSKFDIRQLNPMADMDLHGTSNILEARICGVYGVPPIMAQTRMGLEKSTYSNYEQARKAFYNDSMPIYWDTLGEAFTRDFVQMESGQTDWRVRFDYQSLPEFQDDEQTKATWITALWNSGIITLDEARTAMGFEESDEGGDEYKPSNAGLLAFSEESNDTETKDGAGTPDNIA
jgi:HK97 family phage portal protein